MSLVYPSSEIKKELQRLNSAEITALCLRLARFKKENKELLTYLLFKADDQDAFIKEFKEEMDLQFGKLKGKSYVVVKGLRKVTLEMNNQIRYTGSDLVKVELVLHFCNNYIKYVDYRSHYKPLRNVFYRSVEKAKTVLATLHEDLQHDYGNLYEEMLAEAEAEIYWFEKKLYKL
jgi:hypothetical protein